ncbi:MAG: AzlC family ABC transporter permease [Clostridia bacterium]|nr:AzlC family ABC transporter permease [Clostridia bacterium]
MKYSLKEKENRSVLRQGIIDGIPIGLGYFAVAFSLGVAARSEGVTPLQGFIASLLCNTSTGEHAVFTLMGINAAFIEVALVTLIANARYLLMSFAMSQRTDPKTSLLHRMGMSFFITDEIFGISVARQGYLNPLYTYGAALVAAPCWATGTALGIIAGSALPLRVVSALGVALYGMFIAIIIPPAKKDKIVLLMVLLSFGASYAASVLPVVRDISEGTRTIILTVVLSAAAALIFPKKTEGEGKK